MEAPTIGHTVWKSIVSTQIGNQVAIKKLVRIDGKKELLYPSQVIVNANLELRTDHTYRWMPVLRHFAQRASPTRQPFARVSPGWILSGGGGRVSWWFVRKKEMLRATEGERNIPSRGRCGHDGGT